MSGFYILYLRGGGVNIRNELRGMESMALTVINARGDSRAGYMKVLGARLIVLKTSPGKLKIRGM